MKTMLTAVLAASLAFAVGGCTNNTPGANTDAQITAKVKTQLAESNMPQLARVDVDTTNGTVYLRGTVSTADTKTRAGDIARNTGGVDKVVNNLQISMAGDNPPAANPNPPPPAENNPPAGNPGANPPAVNPGVNPPPAEQPGQPGQPMQ